MRVAFVTGRFPVVSETFIINQVADLIDRGVDVEVFTFEWGDENLVSSRFVEYKMTGRMHRLRAPVSKARRLLTAVPIICRLLFAQPKLLFRALNFIQYGKRAWSLQLLFSVVPFVGQHFDLIHCHFGTTALEFLPIKHALTLRIPMITTFYGYDVSATLMERTVNVYDPLKQECGLFLVMSNNMKQRVLGLGFPEEKVKVHPVSIDVDAYPFSERRAKPECPVELVFVGRLVEKKGCDDLLRALARVKAQTARTFRCTIIGSGPLEKELRRLASSSGLNGAVEFKGAMKVDDIIPLLLEKQILVSPSKTALNGDME